MQEMQVRSLGQEDPLEKEMATHSSILACKTPWIEEPGRLGPWGHKRVRHDLVTKQQQKDIFGVEWLCGAWGDFSELGREGDYVSWGLRSE